MEPYVDEQQQPLKPSFPATVIAPDTLFAYLQTDYRVDGEVPFTLRIGQPCPALSTLHKTHKVQCSAFITACNPLSEPVSDAENAARQDALAQELKRRSLAFLPGVGQHPSSQWPGEPSYLVLGLSLEAAKALGSRLEQNAIVWSGADAVPQLILLR